MVRTALWFALVVVQLNAALARGEDDLFPKPDGAAMARRIDALLAERWAAEGVEPAAMADDAVFLRRAYLDLTGVIPPVSQVRAFLADTRADKRTRLVDALLDSPGHATHLAATWRDLMLPGGFDPQQLASVAGVQNWLRDQFAAGTRYDNIVGDLLVATAGQQGGPALFYTSLELKPEQVAARTAQVFLGVRMQCAQCHDHPYDHWTQQDFWGYAAFFARLKESDANRSPGIVRLIDAAAGEVMLPDTDTVVPPKYPEGSLAGGADGGTRREQLAIWMVSRDNPYLPRAAVNWAWAHLFGRGLVEPVDDFGPHNPASHPQLLDELAEYFVETGFDLQELLRTLAQTRPYQLSSVAPSGKEVPPELFARMSIKPLTAEQLYDSLSRATLRPPPEVPRGVPQANRLFDPARQAFLARMPASRGTAEYQAGVPQALMLMNGELVEELTDGGRGGLLAALDAPLFADEDRIEVLFLATLSREPRDEERSRVLEYVRSAGEEGDRRQAMGNVLWALVNSAEFALNH